MSTSNAIFAPVQTAKFVNPDGTLSSQGILIFNQILQRIGGTQGGTYTALKLTTGVALWNLSSNPIAVLTLASGSNILTITNMVAGAPPYRITLIQPGSGSAGTVTWPSNTVFPGGVAPTLSTANNAVDVFTFVSDGTNFYLMTEGLNYLT